MDKKVKVVNLISSRVNISVPESNVRLVWERKGAIRTLPFDKLEELMYNPGVEALFSQGVLGIEDMEVKKEIGLEPEDADEPQNIKILTDAEMKRYLTVLPANELQTKIKSLKREQIEALVDFAIENEYSDYSRCEVIKKLTGRDIIRAIQLNHQAKEPVKEDEE